LALAQETGVDELGTGATGSSTDPRSDDLVQNGQSANEPEERLPLGLDLLRVGLVVIAVLLLSFTLNVVLFSRLEHSAAQHSLLNSFRVELANGTAPLGPTDGNRLLSLGVPVALLDIPKLHLHEVVVEGTTGGALMSGPGHRRDTPLPGQPGVSEIMGRAATYGGPFRNLHKLKPGDRITVTTQQGVSTFSVLDVRRAGDLEPAPLASGAGRLTLVTAAGRPYVPSGLLYVDAKLTSPVLGAAPVALPVGSIPTSQKAMAIDTGSVWALVLWLEGLVVIAIGAIWSWHRWGHVQTWIVFVPLIAVFDFYLAAQVTRLLPNLM
jgi:LPXTG-site transpeptidase (sortase) family protein